MNREVTPATAPHINESVDIRSYSAPVMIIESTHPCVKAKIDQLQLATVNSKEFRLIVKEISYILAVDAVRDIFTLKEGEEKTSILGHPFTSIQAYPQAENVVLVPVLRAGLSMVDSFLDVIPNSESIAIHHLGLFREKSTLAPVEYYNKLPHLMAGKKIELAVVLDTIIATGGTASAVVSTLREWGVPKIVFISLIGSRKGLEIVQNEWPEGVTVYTGKIYDQIDSKGYILPGIGDVGDRINGT